MPSSGASEPLVLVLDDVHHLRSAEALAVVDAIAGAVPAGSQLVLAGRCEPALPIGRLRAQGRLIELRARDLVMTRREATKVLSLADLELPPEDVQRAARAHRGLGRRALHRRPLAARPGRPAPRRRAVRRRRPAARRLPARRGARRARPRAAALPRAHARCSTSCPDRSATRSCGEPPPASRCATCRARTSSSSRSTSPTCRIATTACSPACCGPSCAGRTRRAKPKLHRRASDWYARAGDAGRAIDHAIAAGDLAARRSAAVEHGGRPRPRRPSRRRPAAGWTASRPSSSPRSRRSRSPRPPTTSSPASATWSSTGPPSPRGRSPATQAALDAGVQAMRAAVGRAGVVAMGRDAARGVRAPARGQPVAVALLPAAGRRDAPAGRRRRRHGRSSRRARAAAPSRRRSSRRSASPSSPCSPSTTATGSRRGCSPRARGPRSSALGLDGHPTCALVFAVSAFVRAHRDRVDEAQADRRRASELLTQARGLRVVVRRRGPAWCWRARRCASAT